MARFIRVLSLPLVLTALVATPAFASASKTDTQKPATTTATTAATTTAKTTATTTPKTKTAKTTKKSKTVKTAANHKATHHHKKSTPKNTSDTKPKS